MRVAFAGHRWVRGLMYGWTAALTLAANPGVARADCLTEAIQSCNADFPPNDWRMVSIRGWCYMYRLGACKIADGAG
jgi:hypothetical protein